MSLVVGGYFDDVFFPDGNYLSKSGSWPSRRLFSLLVFNTSGRKDQIPAAGTRFLGGRGRCRIGENAIRTRATDERALELRGHIAQAVRANGLTPDTARKLRWRLGFPNSLLMGKLCREMMGPMVRRQYGSKAY